MILKLAEVWWQTRKWESLKGYATPVHDLRVAVQFREVEEDKSTVRVGTVPVWVRITKSYAVNQWLIKHYVTIDGIQHDVTATERLAGEYWSWQMARRDAEAAIPGAVQAAYDRGLLS